jgi:hypothetical protein
MSESDKQKGSWTLLDEHLRGLSIPPPHVLTREMVVDVILAGSPKEHPDQASRLTRRRGALMTMISLGA